MEFSRHGVVTRERGHDTHMEREDDEKPEETAEERERDKRDPAETTSGTGALPNEGAPNPGFTARGG